MSERRPSIPATRSGRLRIGCSGFNYNHWRGTFYPEGLPQRNWFDYYSSIFDSVELNVTFYRLVKAATFTHWHDSTPEGFIFAIKGSRYITHVKRLADPIEPLERFFSGAASLGRKLAVVLWQFPPGFACNVERLEFFIECLRSYPGKHAFEFRNESWVTEEVMALCRRNNVALCMADWPTYIDDLPLTSDFVYLRRHGHTGRYDSRYTSEQLGHDALRIKQYRASGRDVHIYFNNDANGYAPQNALELANIIKEIETG